MKRFAKKQFTVVVATATVIFTLFTLFTSTIAWFSTKTSVSVSGGSFSVKAISGLQYNLYYLDHFTTAGANKDGNFNTIIRSHAGYEVSNNSPVFQLINFDEDGNVIDAEDNIVDESLNPTNISHLWPAHRLTYAMVVEGGDMSKFTLASWGEETDDDVKTKDTNENDVLISLSWAINIYGAAYNITATNNVLADIATCFASNYRTDTLNDTFLYSQESPAPTTKTPIDVVDSVSGESSDSTRQILFFTIEFDNSNSTYYAFDGSYYVKSTSGNSNCYEHLSLKDLVFQLV